METLHPIFVHFPIALLTLYACIEILSLFIKKWKNNSNLLFMKTILLIVWSIWSSLASNSGEAAKHAIGLRTLLVERHELFAGLSTSIFWGLTLFYILKWVVSESGQHSSLLQKLSWTTKSLIAKIISFIESYYIIYLWACVGFFALTITWALWWAIVYGKDADVIVQRIVRMVGA